MSLQKVLLVIFVTVQLFRVEASSRNEFESTYGCLQYYSDAGYYTDHPYFATNQFKNIETNNKGVTKLRFGVLGQKHAAIRFTSVSYASDTSMTEIALSHWQNTRTDIRKYPRTIPKGLNSKHLAELPMKNLMSISKPVMMTMEISQSGLVTVTKDGESSSFIRFNDPTFSHKYMGIAKWDVPVVLFYDCPLNPGGVPSQSAAAPECPPQKQPDCSKCQNLATTRRPPVQTPSTTTSPDYFYIGPL